MLFGNIKSAFVYGFNSDIVGWSIFNFFGRDIKIKVDEIHTVTMTTLLLVEASIRKLTSLDFCLD